MATHKTSRYLSADGESAFGHWFADLDAQAGAKVTVVLMRMEQGNFSDMKGVGAGVFERRLHFGPDHRIYFGKDGGRYEEVTGQGYPGGSGEMGRLQAA